MAIKIILAEDHKILIDGLRYLLESQADFSVVGLADNGRSAVKITQEQKPDVVLMDVRMPDLNGVDATRQIIAANAAVKVICLSAHSDERTAREMFKAGAAGYVLKQSAFTELAMAIRAVMAGKTYISAGVAREFAENALKIEDQIDGSSAGHGMSGREREVLQLISEGKSTKEIARELSLSVKTIETHRRNLMEKLNIDSVAELTKYAVREGITSL